MECVESLEPFESTEPIDLGYDPGELDFWEEETVELHEVSQCYPCYSYLRWESSRTIDTDSISVRLTFDDPLDFAHQAPQLFITIAFDHPSSRTWTRRTITHRLPTWLLLAIDAGLDYRIDDRTIELPLRPTLDRRAADITSIRVQTDGETRCRCEFRFRTAPDLFGRSGLENRLGPMVGAFNFTDIRCAHSIQINMNRSHRQLLIAIGGAPLSQTWVGGTYKLIDCDSPDPPPSLELIRFTRQNETLEYRAEELDLITLRDLTIYRLTIGADFDDLFDGAEYRRVEFSPTWSFDPPPELRGYMTLIYDLP